MRLRLDSYTLHAAAAWTTTQANLGTAQLLVNALQQQGLSAAAARSRIWMVDSKGLLLRSRSRSSLSPKKAAFAQDASNLAAPLISSSSSSSGRPPPLADVIHAVQPTALIGAAAVPGAFDELAIRALSQVRRCAPAAAVQHVLACNWWLCAHAACAWIGSLLIVFLVVTDVSCCCCMYAACRPVCRHGRAANCDGALKPAGRGGF